MTTAWSDTTAEVAETGARTLREPLRRRAGIGFRGRVAWIAVTPFVSPPRTYRVRIAWGDGTSGTGSVTVLRGTVLEVRGRHTWRRPVRGRVTVTVTDVATAGVLTIRRPLRVTRSSAPEPD